MPGMPRRLHINTLLSCTVDDYINMFKKGAVLLALTLLIGVHVVHAVSNDIKLSMTRYVDKKVKDLSEYEKYVCKRIGTDPSSFDCWNKDGEQRNAGGACQSPKGCLIYETPSFGMKNKLVSWSGSQTFNQLKNQLFKAWGLSKTALDEIEMATLMEKGKFVDIHVYTETKKSTGNYKFELATVETHSNGNVKNIGYINIKSKGWIIKPRRCISVKKKKGGAFGKGGTKRSCSERSLRQREIDKVRRTLELYAFKSIDSMIGGSKAITPPCKKEFNCYCYMERNKGKVPSGGSEECLAAYDHFVKKGKKQGLKATCCAHGARVQAADNNAQLLYGKKNCKEGVTWYHDKKKKEIRVSDGCKGTFECNGDILSCESSTCEQATASRARSVKFRRQAYSSCKKRCGFDTRKRKFSYNPQPAGRGKYRQHLNHRQYLCTQKCKKDKTCYNVCVQCLEECVGCSKNCKCKNVKVRRRLSHPEMLSSEIPKPYARKLFKDFSKYSNNHKVHVLRSRGTDAFVSLMLDDDDSIYQTYGRNMIDRRKSVADAEYSDDNRSKRKLMHTGLIDPKWTKGNEQGEKMFLDEGTDPYYGMLNPDNADDFEY